MASARYGHPGPSVDIIPGPLQTCQHGEWGGADLPGSWLPDGHGGLGLSAPMGTEVLSFQDGTCLGWVCRADGEKSEGHAGVPPTLHTQHTVPLIHTPKMCPPGTATHLPSPLTSSRKPSLTDLWSSGSDLPGPSGLLPLSPALEFLIRLGKKASSFFSQSSWKLKALFKQIRGTLTRPLDSCASLCPTTCGHPSPIFLELKTGQG